jgi:ankyrin repeat protein
MDLTKLVIRAAKKGDVIAIGKLLDSDPTLIDARDDDGSTLLHCAAWKGQDAAAALLLKRGASVTAENDNDHYGGTPLHAAAHANNKTIAAMLLEHGADPSALSRLGRTPLDETTIHNASAVARLLKDRLAAVREADQD